jgi:hypothetical protein
MKCASLFILYLSAKSLTGLDEFSNLNHFDPEGGGSTYLRNVGNTAQVHTVQRPKSRNNDSNESLLHGVAAISFVAKIRTSSTKRVRSMK